MSNISKWYNEASSKVKVHLDSEGKFLIYKGFKILKSTVGYSLRDVRHSEFYTPVKKRDHVLILKYGFIEGVDRINFCRNEGKIEGYNTKIKVQQDKKEDSQKELPINKRLNEKRIRVANEKIDYYSDLKLLLQSRNKQLKIKYNL